MAIRRSAAAETEELLEALAGADAVARDTAAARLSAIGARVVPHLLAGFRASSSAVARATILKILEATRDRHGLVLALDVLSAPSRDPAVAGAAIGLLGTFLDDDRTQALEALGATVIDQDRPELERLAAWRMLERMPDRILAPLRRRLLTDPSAAMARVAGAAPSGARAGDGSPAIDAAEILETAAAGAAADPAVLRAALEAAGPDVPLTTLNRLVESSRAAEARQHADADRQEWLMTRAAAHLAVARRGSRVAIYDARDALANAAAAIPDGFVAAMGLVGDADCLESIADALARVPPRLDAAEQQWRDRLLEAGRAIVTRERLSRRHAAVRRLHRRHPEIAAVLLG